MTSKKNTGKSNRRSFDSDAQKTRVSAQDGNFVERGKTKPLRKKLRGFV